MRKTPLIFLSLLIFFVDTTYLIAGEFNPDTLLKVNTQLENSNSEKPEENQNTTELNEEELELGKKEFIRDTLIYYTAIWIFRFFYVRNKNSRIFDTSLEDYFDNILDWPEVDDGDTFFTNYVVHPIAGAISYLYYREMGHDFWTSALGSLVQSTLFEYTVEGLVETPSLPDLIATPLVGVPLGYSLEKSSDWLLERDNKALRVLGKLVNPVQNFVKDRKLVIFNPVSGQFEYSDSFVIKPPPPKPKSIDLGYPVFFEPAIPRGYFGAFLEFSDVEKNKFGGEFIFYHVKTELPSKDFLKSIYIRLSQAGINNITFNGRNFSDGFEFANLQVGGKYLFYKHRNLVMSSGLEIIFPTAYKDNLDRLQVLLNHHRDFPLYLKDAFTFSPYFAMATWHRFMSLQGYVGYDLITNADNFEGDGIEHRIKYSLATGIAIPYKYLPLLFVEFDGFTLLTADTFDKTDLFLSTGFRFGRRYSPGVTVQFPLEGSTAEISDFSVMADIKIRF